MGDNQFSRRDFLKKGLLTTGAAALGALKAQAAGSNSITTENANTGTPQSVWDVGGVGDNTADLAWARPE